MRRLLLVAGAAVAFSAAGADGAHVTYPGGNGRIAFVRENPRYSDEMAGIFHTDLWSVTVGRRAQPLLLRRNYVPTPLEPDWSADGSRIAFSLNCSMKYALGCSYLATARADGKGMRLLVPGGLGTRRPNDFSPSWSPDGAELALSTYGPGPTGIAIVRADGSNRRMLTAGGDQAPAWAPDGARIVFVRAGDLYSVAVGATPAEPARLTSGAETDESPSWSPDAQWLAFDRHGPRGARGVFVVRADGSQARRLAIGRTPAWSPDGRWIAFARSADIWVMRADGTRQRRLTTSKRYEADPAWQPLRR
jgi:Tol biopolymer transport system component